MCFFSLSSEFKYVKLDFKTIGLKNTKIYYDKIIRFLHITNSNVKV